MIKKSAVEKNSNLAVIINIKAKNAHQAEPYIAALDAAGFNYKLYQVEPEILAETIQTCITKHDIILIGGGDGTIRTAAQYCAKTSKILGVLALGTLNHFAKELSLPQNPDEIITSLKEHTTTIVDLAEVNGHIFVNNSSIGFYPKFAKKRDLYTKKYNKWLSYFPSFIESFQKHESYSLMIKSDKLNILLRTSFLMISNNIYSYEFPATVKRDSFNKGLLGIYYFKYGKMRFLKIIRMFFNRKNNFEVKQSDQPVEIHFDNQKKTTISLDGDTVKIDTPLRYRILPESLLLLTRK